MANLRAGTTVGGDAVFTVGNISSYGLNFLNGNIGIGTDSPDFLLDLEQKDGGVQLQMGRTNTSAGSAWMGADSTGFHLGVGTYAGIQNSAFTIDSNGNVGIGTTSPNYKLDVQTTDSYLSQNLKINKSSSSDNHIDLAFQLWSGAGTGQHVFGNANYTSRPSAVIRATSVDSAAKGDLLFATFSGGANNSTLTEKMRIRHNGNVGIGTTSPDQILTTRPTQVGKYGVHVIKPETNDSLGGIFVETDGTSSFYLKDRDSADISTVRIKAKGDSYFAGGNVGIGTTDTVSYRLNVNGSTNVQGTLYTDALYLKSSAFEMWHRSYTVRSDNPQVILQENGSEIDDGGAYRVTAHIPSTSTHTGATAVFWNSGGKWYVNQTVQPTHSSNNIGFYVTSDNKPTIQTWHTNDYSISVLHERVFLGESNTENTRFLFGMDGMISYKNDGHLYLNSFDSDNSSSSGNKILRQTSFYSGWEIYKVGSNGFIMGHNSTEDTNFWLGANMTYDSGGWKSLEAGRSSWCKLGGSDSGDAFVVYSDLSTESGEIVTTEGNEMIKVTNTTTYDHGNANVHAGNIATYLPDHNHNASEITAGTLSSARIPAATADNLGGVKVSYNAASQTLNITTS